MSAALQWHVASRPMPGELISGDGHLVLRTSWGELMAVVDGLGHGAPAAAAARAAVLSLEENAEESLPTLLERCHKCLRGTRGAALSLCAVDPRSGTMSWAGVGNVTGVLWRADPATAPAREVLIPRPGVLGSLLPPGPVPSLRIACGDTLALATDGVHGAFVELVVRDEAPQPLAERLLATYRANGDDALIMVARYVEEVQ